MYFLTECADSFRSCQRFVDNGQCWEDKFKGWMKSRCKKSCEYCSKFLVLSFCGARTFYFAFNRSVDVKSRIFGICFSHRKQSS